MSGEDSTCRSLSFRHEPGGVLTAVMMLIGTLGLMYFINPSWAWTDSGYIDPWMYLNYFLDYPGQGPWPDYYKVSRVPWDATGTLATIIFGIRGGQIALAAASLAGLGLGSFLLMRRLPREAVAVTVTAFVLVPLFHGNGGWLYQNAISEPLLLLSAAVSLSALRAFSSQDTVRAGKPDLRTLGFGATLGALLALLLIVNTLVVLAALPLVTIVAFTCVRHRGLSSLLLTGIAAAVGGALILVFSALASHLMGGRWAFWLPLLDTFVGFADSRDDTVWFQPWSTGWWRSNAYFAIIPIAFLVTFAYIAIFRRRIASGISFMSYDNPATLTIDFIVFWNLGVAVIWIGCYSLLKMHLLNWSFHAYPLLGTSVLVVCSALAWPHLLSPESARQAARWTWLLVISCFVVVTVLLLWIPWSSYAAFVPGLFKLAVFWSALIVGATSLAMIIGLARVPWRSKRGSAICASLISVLIAVILVTPAMLSRQGENYRPGGCVAPQISNDAISNAFVHFRWLPTMVPVLIASRNHGASVEGPCSLKLSRIADSLTALYPFAAPIEVADLSKQSLPEGFAVYLFIDSHQTPTIGTKDLRPFRVAAEPKRLATIDRQSSVMMVLLSK